VRRILLCALAMFFVLGVASGASAATAGRPVDGTLTGPGGFRFEGCPGTITEIGSGTFRAQGLGPGTYAFNVCVSLSIDGTFTFDGTITFTTAGGATLTGTISGTSGGGTTFDVVITGGTKQFAHAGGTLTVGPLVQSDRTNCRVGICLDWRDTGPITGTITNVA
jgi:hypothetical protein